MTNLTNLNFMNSNFGSFANSSYIEIYKKNFVLGYNIGAGTAVANSLGAPKIYEYPFLNRFINLGSYNALQDVFFARSNLDCKTTIDNFYYLGILQTAKYIPNLITQNMMKRALYSDKELSTPMKFAKNFLTVSTGMKVFFMIGAIESKILDEVDKMKFTMITSSLLFFSYILTGPFDSKFIKATEETHLSLNGYVATTLGLVGSFVIPDVMHRIGIDKGGLYEPDKALMLDISLDTAVALISGFDVNLVGLTIIANQVITKPFIHSSGIDKIELYGYNALDIASLTIMTAATLSQGNWINVISMILAFADAKAESVTGVEIAYDNREYICSNFQLKPVCEYLGIVDVSFTEATL